MPDGTVTEVEVAAPETNRGLAALGGIEEPVEAVESEVEKEVEVTVEAPAAPVVDAQALAKAFGDVISEKFPQPTKEEKKVDELTPEEAKKLLNVWEPTKEWQTKFDNLDTREIALQEMRDGVVKHTDTVSQYRLREATTAIESKFAPALEYMQRKQEEESRDRFNTAYGQLADPALEPLLTSVADSLRKTGKKFDDEKSLFAALASGAEAIIKVSQPDFKLTAGSIPAKQKTAKPAGGIPVTTPGAGGGGGGSKGEGKPVSRGLAIFG